MTVRERVEQLKSDDFVVNHKALGNTQLLEDDWIRIYKSKTRGNVDGMLYSCNREDIDFIPNDILDLEFDYVDCWMIGGNLASDMVLIQK